MTASTDAGTPGRDMRMKAQAKANARYRAKYCKTVTVQFFPSDLELYEHLEQQESKAGYIKGLIREDMNRR